MKVSQQGRLGKNLVNSAQTLPVARAPITVFDPRAAPVLPPKPHLIEVMEIFFNNQYQGIFPFIHKPSLLAFLRSDEFDPATYIQKYRPNSITNYLSSLSNPDPFLLLSIMALCARLHKVTSFAYGNFREDNAPESFKPDLSVYDGNDDGETWNQNFTYASSASKYFGWHARQLAKEVFDAPTIQRIQAFTLLSSHEWGEGNNSRSFLYTGIAARMALVLGLGKESEEEPEDGQIDHISLESKRRTIWSVYMMDKCNSSGRQRSLAIRIEEIAIRLPSLEHDFHFGNGNQSWTHQELSIRMGTQLPGGTNKVTLVGFTIMLFEIWAKIAKWVGEVGVANEKVSPWLPESPFHRLVASLDEISLLLPPEFKLTQVNLNSHIELGTAAQFGYFHILLITCRVFLNREYLFCNPQSFPKGWWNNLVSQLLDSLKSITSLVQILRANNMMVVAPFTGFWVFTCAVTLFYFCAFPNQVLLENLPVQEYGIEGNLEELKAWKFEYKMLALTNLDILANWSQMWELGRTWQRLLINLGVIFGQLAENGSNTLISDLLRESMNEYGSSRLAEVFSPQKMSTSLNKNERELIRLLNPEGSELNSMNAAGISQGMSPSAASIQLLSIPELSFPTKLASIYPGWNMNDLIDLVEEKYV